MKPCIVIVLVSSSSPHIDQVPLTYISPSIDFVRINTKVCLCFSVAMIARIMKLCIVIVLDMLHKHAH